jgi:hypothetical protein
MGLLDLIKNLMAGAAPAESLAENEPGSPALFEHALGALLHSDKQEFITISGNDDAIVQVAKGGDVLQLNIASYPSSDNPDEKLNALGIVLPAGSTLGEWEPNVYAQYAVPSSTATELSTVIDAVFCKLYGTANGYTVSVALEN